MNQSQVQARIAAELADLAAHPVDNCVLLYDPSIFTSTIHGFFIGPQNTPYEGGLFTFTVEFPEYYPNTPVKLTLKTDILHPGIYNQFICLRILRNQWSSTVSLRMVFKDLQAFLESPDFDKFVNQEAANLQLVGRFEQEAEIVTLTHAH